MKYIVGGIGVVVVLAIFISIIFAVVSRSGDDLQLEEPGFVLSESIDRGSEVNFIVYGRIVADEEFRAIRISINQQRRVMEVLSGYNFSVEGRYELPNTAASYEAFLFAIESEGFLQTRLSEHDSENGKCSNGRRYIYEVAIDDSSEHRTWSTSCRNIRGTFNGQTRAIERLFQAQIPDYRGLTRQVKL